MRIRSGGRHRRRFGRPFARLWVGFTLASSGDGFAYGAVPLLAVVVDPHPLAVSAVIAADSLPWLLLALPAGAFADRFERGPVMAFANIVRATAILVAAALVATNRINLALLIIVVLINAGARATYYSSLQAMVPELVRSDGLERANGVLTGTEAGTEYLAGPVVGTSLFAVGKSLPFLADAVALIASCIPFVGLPSKTPAPAETSNSIWEGARLLFADRRLRVLVLMVASLSLFQGMEGGVLVLLATTEWGVREGLYGLFLAATAVGNLLGSALADGQVRRFGSARTLIGAAVVSGVGYLLMASAHSWVLAAPAFALGGRRRRRHHGRRHLAPPAADPQPPHGPRGQRLARPRVGRGTGRSARCRKRGDARGTAVAVGPGGVPAVRRGTRVRPPSSPQHPRRPPEVGRRRRG